MLVCPYWTRATSAGHPDAEWADKAEPDLERGCEIGRAAVIDDRNARKTLVAAVGRQDHMVAAFTSPVANTLVTRIIPAPC